MMCRAILASFSCSAVSVSSQIMSNRETNGGARFICAVNGMSETGSNLPLFGLAAASTAHLVRRLALIPALAVSYTHLTLPTICSV